MRNYSRGINPIAVAIAGVVLIAIVSAGIIGFAFWWSYEHTPVAGTVVHRQHSDAYWYHTSSCGGTPYTCTGHNNYMPASWQLCVTGVDRHGRLSEDCVEVSKASWFAHPEGSEWKR